MSIRETAVAAAWQGAPVWVHGIPAGNLLVRDGRLAAVIDFGSSGVGDPACDVTIAWTLLSGETGRRFVPRFHSTPRPGREAAVELWKALITFAGNLDTDPAAAMAARRVINDVLASTSDRREIGPLLSQCCRRLRPFSSGSSLADLGAIPR